MYRVWYWQNGELNMVSCGKFSDYAWRVLVNCFEVHYHPYLEYIKG
jgi:hypothetical protein